jgi:hypothetical protein
MLLFGQKSRKTRNATWRAQLQRWVGGKKAGYALKFDRKYF